MLKKVMNSCQFVYDNSHWVKINYEKIKELILPINNTHWLQNNPYGILNLDIENLINFILVYHSIGFSFWGNPKWTIATPEGNLDGSYALMYLLLNKTIDNPNFLNFNYLSNISLDEFKKLLEGNVEIPLLIDRYNNLISLSEVVSNKMNNNFYNYIKDINNDEDLFSIIINEFPDVFNDISNYKGKTIFLYKLAQLITSDILHVKQIKENALVDYSHIVGCADYKIPQILRNLGILEFHPALEELVDNRIEIPKDSEMEIEIRANTIIAIKELSKKFETNPIDINDRLWLKSQEKNIAQKPYHLTRNRFY